MYASPLDFTINLTDPSGQFVWFAALAGLAVGGILGGVVETFSQLSQNGWQWDCLDKTKIGLAMLEGAAMGAISGGFAFTGLVDFTFGVGWDMALHGESLESAVVNGLLGAAIGVGTDALIAGAKRVGRAVQARGGLRAIGRSIGDSLSRAWNGVDDDVARGINNTTDNGLRLQADPLIDNNVLAEAFGGNKDVEKFLNDNKGLITVGQATYIILSSLALSRITWGFPLAPGSSSRLC